MGIIPASVTDAAKQRLLSMAGDKPGIVLSIAKGKGCGGNEYKWGDFVTDAPAGHESIPVTDKFTIYVPFIDSFNMFGMTIDYGPDGNQKMLGSENFKFVNPNETGRCGCGVSLIFKDQPNP